MAMAPPFPRSMVVGNWNVSQGTAAAVAERASDVIGVTVVLCPPFSGLTAVRSAAAGAGLAIAVPAICHKEGMEKLTDELTLEWSAAVLAASLDYVLVGHWKWKDVSPRVARETNAALWHGIRPIICVGDASDNRRGESIDETMRRQVSAALSDVSAEYASSHIAVAYEPVWAIETARTLAVSDATPAQRAIRNTIADLWGQEAMATVPVLYGGIVNPSNAVDFADAGFNGVLASDASMDATAFLEIAKAFSTPALDTGSPHPPPAEPDHNDRDFDDEALTAEQQAVSFLLKRRLLPVISEMENALQYLDERERQGLELIRDELQAFQEWARITRVGTLGEHFDPNIHRAIGTDERPEYPSLSVVEVVQPGYRVESMVVQKAEVIVNR